MLKWGLGVAGLLLVSSCALAGESTDLQKQIDELKAKVNALEQKSAGPAAPAAEPKGGLWTDNFKLSGDLRLRGEYFDTPHRETDVADRERMRFRARVGLDAKVNDEVDVRVRIATDMSTSSEKGGDPTSNNQDMTNDSSKKGLWLDLAMFDYHPKAVEGLHVLGGKIEQPFVTVGGNDMIWSGALTPEGGAVKYGPKFEDFELIAVAGAFWIKEHSAQSPDTDTADSGIFGGQLGLKYNLAEKTYILAGGGYFDYAHAQGFPVFDYDTGTARDFGNSVSEHDEYLYDYDLAEAFVEVGFPVPGLELPLTVFGNWVRNTAIHDDSEGYLVGARLGKLEKQWDWSLYYDYRVIEKDAVVGAFNGTDAFGGGTDGRGHKIGAELQLMKNVWAGAYYYQDKDNISSADTTDHDAIYRRVQLDINFKF